MSNNASRSHPRPDGEEDRPACRQRLVEGDFGEPDVLLLSDDDVEYPAHRNMLNATCELFSDMFEVASSDAESGALPRIPLLADSATVEMVLPLAYRQSAANLRSKPYQDLEKGIRLAHRLGMPLVVDAFAIYLEAHVPDHGFELYMLARTLGLPYLEGLCQDAAVSVHDLAQPNQHVRDLGQTAVDELHRKKLEKVLAFSAYAQKRVNSLKEAEESCKRREGHEEIHSESASMITELLAYSTTLVLRLSVPSMKTPQKPHREWDWFTSLYEKVWYCKFMVTGQRKDVPLCPVLRQLVLELQGLEKEFRSTMGTKIELTTTKSLSEVIHTWPQER